MRNFLALIAALVLIFLGLGWYLGWYRIASTTTEEGHRLISIDLNTQRIKATVRDLFDGKEGATPAPPNTTPAKTVPGSPTGFKRDDGSFVFPGEPFAPVPPGGGPTLPPPR